MVEENDELIDLYELLKVGSCGLSTEFAPKNLEFLKKGFEMRQEVAKIRLNGNLYKSADLIGSLKKMGYEDVEPNVFVDGILFPAYSKQQ